MTLLIAIIASFFVGASKGGLPMVSLLAVSLLSLFMQPSIAAGMLLPIYLLSDVYGLYIYRNHFSKWNLLLLIPAGILGVVIGFLSVRFIDERWVMLTIALIGFSYLISDLLLKRSPKNAKSKIMGWFWGALAGIGSYFAHAGGPPFQAYVLPQRLEKLVFAGTSTIFFAVINLVKLPFYIANDQLAAINFASMLVLCPVALLGVWAGYRIVHHLPKKQFFALIRIMLFVVSAKLLVDAQGWS